MRTTGPSTMVPTLLGTEFYADLLDTPCCRSVGRPGGLQDAPSPRTGSEFSARVILDRAAVVNDPV
jgi:hypothetical protein